MPDLAWDIAETQLTQEAQKENNPNMTPPLQTLVTVIILIIAIVKQTAQVSACFTQRLNVKMETPEHKTLKNALVTTNEALNTTCKYSVNHAPSHTSHRNSSG